MIVLLDRRTLKPSLPDLPNAAMPPVVPPRVRHQKRWHDSADGNAWLTLEREVEVVGHQAGAVEAQGTAELYLSERGVEVGIVVEDVLPVVCTSESMRAQTQFTGRLVLLLISRD